MLLVTARVVDGLALAYALGATIWFFFVQTPVLLKRMGRDAFVPLQMALARVLFRSVSLALAVMLGAALLTASSPSSMAVLSAAVALAGGVLNGWFAVPRALRTGGRSLKENLTEAEQKSLERFVVDGGGEATRFWHRVVVLFVVVMVVGLVPHLVSLVSAAG